MAGTSNYQIQNRLKHVQYFMGVYSSNNLPQYQYLRRDSALIANYSDNHSSGTHWIAMVHLNNPDRMPEYFDSFGFDADSDNPLLNTQAKFKEYITKLSKYSGFRGEYVHSSENLQCITGDVCGEFCVLCVLKNSIPNDYDGNINKEWKDIIMNSEKMPCNKYNSYIKRLAGIRK